MAEQNDPKFDFFASFFEAWRLEKRSIKRDRFFFLVTKYNFDGFFRFVFVFRVLLMRWMYFVNQNQNTEKLNNGGQ